MDEIITAEAKPRKMIHVLNPKAGKGIAAKIKKTIKSDEYIYVSQSAEASSEFIKKTCDDAPDTCYTVYGGDGTVFRAVNALMESGHNKTASLKIVPTGSGNDFVRSFEGDIGEHRIDVMRFNDKYAVNVINMGFDCGVVQRAVKFKQKPLINGKMAYICGVVGELINKKPMNLKIELTYPNGETELLSGEYLLMAIANAKWYGGGFKVAPLADVSDGLLDVMIIKNISRRLFMSFVGGFRSGTLIDENGEPKEKLKDILYYKKCISVKVEGCDTVCADGEIFKESHLDISVVPNALNYIKD